MTKLRFGGDDDDKIIIIYYILRFVIKNNETVHNFANMVSHSRLPLAAEIAFGPNSILYYTIL